MAFTICLVWYILINNQAPSTLIRFQTKTELSTLQRRIRFKTLLCPHCTCSNELDACAFQYIGPQNWREIEATWQRLSAILGSHGRVVQRLVVSQNSVFKKHRFQIALLWRSFLNGSVSSDRFRRCSVDDSRIRSKTASFSFENGLVWTGPQTTSPSFLQAGSQRGAAELTIARIKQGRVVVLLKYKFTVVSLHERKKNVK